VPSLRWHTTHTHVPKLTGVDAMPRGPLLRPNLNSVFVWRNRPLRIWTRSFNASPTVNTPWNCRHKPRVNASMKCTGPTRRCSRCGNPTDDYRYRCTRRRVTNKLPVKSLRGRESQPDMSINTLGWTTWSWKHTPARWRMIPTARQRSHVRKLQQFCVWMRRRENTSN
jgi:hypothetical protein